MNGISCCVTGCAISKRSVGECDTGRVGCYTIRDGVNTDWIRVRQSTSALTGDLDPYTWVFQIPNAIPGSMQVSATE